MTSPSATRPRPAPCLRAAGARGAEGERGATAAEYALLVALIAAVIVTVVAALGLSVRDLFNSPELLDAFS